MQPSTSAASEPFPVRRVADVPERSPEARWLVEGLWARAGVGILGGLPKCKKTFLAVDLALSVATGKPVLGRFAVRDPGPVLFFGAEDDAPALRERFAGLAMVRGVALDEARVLLLDADELRLDRADHLARLDATVAEHAPRLLVLDPFVRLAGRIDENSATDVSSLLGALRRLQRARDVAVLVVHHMRKARTAHPGQQLRGSGDFAAWTDSALFLTRHGAAALLLTIEHRGAPAPDPLSLRLVSDPAPHLALDSSGDASPTPQADPLEAAVLAALADAGPQHTVALQRTLRVRKESVVRTVAALAARGLVARCERGWALVDG